MRDLGDGVAGTAGAAVLSAPTVDEIEIFTGRLAADAAGLSDADRIDRIAALELLRCASEASQHETVADFIQSQRLEAAERGVPAERRDRGLASQVAPARRVPCRAQGSRRLERPHGPRPPTYRRGRARPASVTRTTMTLVELGRATRGSARIP